MEVPAVPTSIITQISDAEVEPGWKAPADADGPETVAQPPDRPDDHAQWDEVHGCWIEWDPDTGSWRPEIDPPGSSAT